MDKRKIIGTIVGSVLFIVCMLAVTYAWYTWRSTNTNVNLAIEDVKFEFITDSSVNVTGIGPILDYTNINYYTEANKNKYLVYTDFTASNSVDKDYNMNVNLNISRIDSSLKDESFKYVLLEKSSTNNYDKIIREGSFKDFVVGDNNIVSDVVIKGNTSVAYRFVVYIDGNMYNDSSMMNSTLESILELDASLVGLASQYIMDLYNDGSSINTVNIANNTANPSVSLNSNQGIMLDNNGEYRYYGANPNNYVEFNDELWRIISVSDVEDDKGNVEKRLKIIRNKSIGTYAYDNKTSGTGTSNSSAGSNNWTDARLMMMLNPGYEDGATDSSGNTIYGYEGSLYWNSKRGTCYSGSSSGTKSCDFTNTGLSSDAKSMIGKAKFYLGGSSSTSRLYADDYYNFERRTTVYSGHATEWTGYVGIMYPSDYVYAADLSLCTRDGYNYEASGSNCGTTDWLKLGSREWTLAPNSAELHAAFLVLSTGRVDGYYDSVYIANAVRPASYLRSNVTIVSGEGTVKQPYQLG